MNIYEIDKGILDLIDPETGEVSDYETFQNLQMERNAKVENVALWIKELTAEAKAIRDEENALAERRKAAENKVERLKEYLVRALDGEKFKTPKVAISYRASEAVDISDGFIEWADKNAPELLKYAEPSPSKTAIKEAIKNGKEIQFATIETKSSIQIK